MMTLRTTMTTSMMTMTRFRSVLISDQHAMKLLASVPLKPLSLADGNRHRSFLHFGPQSEHDYGPQPLLHMTKFI